MYNLVIVIVLIATSCSTTTRTVPIENIRHDTIYLSNIQYDSIHVLQDKYTDRSKDTLLIKETNVEYRYKLLRDTIRIVQRDSIPYEVRITEVKKPPNSFDYFCYLSFGILIGIIGWKFLRIIKTF